jgi:hypothetical protein
VVPTTVLRRTTVIVHLETTSNLTSTARHRNLSTQRHFKSGAHCIGQARYYSIAHLKSPPGSAEAGGSDSAKAGDGNCVVASAEAISGGLESAWICAAPRRCKFCNCPSKDPPAFGHWKPYVQTSVPSSTPRCHDQRCVFKPGTSELLRVSLA